MLDHLSERQTNLPKAAFENFSDRTLSFYTKPMLGKWLKTFPKARILLLLPDAPNLAPWQKRFPKASIEWRSFSANQPVFNADADPWDCIVFYQPTPEAETLQATLAHVRKGGMLVWVTANLHATWPTWQSILTAETMVDLYPAALHPQGAYACFPLTRNRLALFFGRLLGETCVFFPGHYELGLRFGQNWLVRGLKRDDVTVL